MPILCQYLSQKLDMYFHYILVVLLHYEVKNMEYLFTITVSVARVRVCVVGWLLETFYMLCFE